MSEPFRTGVENPWDDRNESMCYDFSGLTAAQLARLDRNVMDRVDNQYGHVTWDWPTLNAVYPEFCRIMKLLRLEYRKRETVFLSENSHANCKH